MTKESSIFQGEVEKLLSKRWHKHLTERKVNIDGVKKKFDLVSDDESYVGDAKYYKNLKAPTAKLSTIAEYVWLLEKTEAKRKFLIFGNDIEVPRRWLKKFGSLTKVKFYF